MWGRAGLYISKFSLLLSIAVGLFLTYEDFWGGFSESLLACTFLFITFFV